MVTHHIYFSEYVKNESGLERVNRVAGHWLTGTATMMMKATREMEYSTVKLGLLISMGLSLRCCTKGGFKVHRMAKESIDVIVAIPTLECSTSPGLNLLYSHSAMGWNSWLCPGGLSRMVGTVRGLVLSIPRSGTKDGAGAVRRRSGADGTTGGRSGKGRSPICSTIRWGDHDVSLKGLVSNGWNIVSIDLEPPDTQMSTPERKIHVEENISERADEHWDYTFQVPRQNYTVMLIVDPEDSSKPCPIKILGCYATEDAADKAAKKISAECNFFNAFVAENNNRLPVPRTADFIENVEYQEVRMMETKDAFVALKERNEKKVIEQVITEAKTAEGATTPSRQ